MVVVPSDTSVQPTAVPIPQRRAHCQLPPPEHGGEALRATRYDFTKLLPPSSSKEFQLRRNPINPLAFDRYPVPFPDGLRAFMASSWLGPHRSPLSSIPSKVETCPYLHPKRAKDSRLCHHCQPQNLEPAIAKPMQTAPIMIPQRSFRSNACNCSHW